MAVLLRRGGAVGRRSIASLTMIRTSLIRSRPIPTTSAVAKLQRSPVPRRKRRGTTACGWRLRRAACAVPLQRRSQISTAWWVSPHSWWDSPAMRRRSRMSCVGTRRARWCPRIVFKMTCRVLGGAGTPTSRTGWATGAVPPPMISAAVTPCTPRRRWRMWRRIVTATRRAWWLRALTTTPPPRKRR